VTASLDWLERQYWADVVAVRPDTKIDQQIADSRVVRESEAHAATIDLCYGNDERQRLDLFCPEGEGPWPLLVFIHGGYWQLGSKDAWAFLAPGWIQKRVAVANLGYRLVPAVTLEDVAGDVRAALDYLAANAKDLRLDISRVMVTGVSAGAHLAAMAVTAENLSTHQLSPIGAVLLSGVYDPRPLEGTTPGAALSNSTLSDLSRFSPLGRPPPPSDCYCLIAWGADETTVFHTQSRLLAAHWENWGVTATAMSLPNTNHYTVVDNLLAGRSGPVGDFVHEQLCGDPK
jgi:arylformamidase